MSRIAKISAKDEEPEPGGGFWPPRVGVITYDAEARCCSVSETAAQLLGVSQEALLGQALCDSSFWKDCGLLALAEEALAGATHRVLMSDDSVPGAARRLEVCLEPIVMAGRPALHALFVEAAAHRGETVEVAGLEKALRGSRERFRELVDETCDLLFSFDEQGVFTAVNKSLAALARRPLPRIVGARLDAIGLPPDLATRWESARVEVMRSGDSRELETFIPLPEGKPRVFEVTLRPILSAEKVTIGVRGSARDITERLATEEQLRQAQKMEALGSLAGGIAHDFNNLLTVIIGNSTLALGVMDPEDQNLELIEEVRQVGERAAGLTRQILAFSRRQELQPRMLSLNEVLEDLEPLLRRTVGEDVELIYRLAADLALTEVDPSQMEQVVMNLVINARDAMTQGGRLTLETANVELDRSYARTHLEVRPGPYVLLAVSDTGCGMTKETASHIFEPFFTSKDPGMGTGLGLSTVFGIVKQSHGNVSLYSELGVGTTFRIYLPSAGAVSAQGLEAASALDLAQGSGRVLVVEDDPSLRELVVRVLSRAGYEVAEAGSATEALAAAQEMGASSDLVLTDVILPGGEGGLDLAARLLARNPNLSVIYMSGYPRSSGARDGRFAAGADYLEKPFTPEALLQRVQKALAAARP